MQIKITMGHDFIPIRMAIVKILIITKITSVGEDVEKIVTRALLVGMYNRATSVENSMTVPQKTTCRITVW